MKEIKIKIGESTFNVKQNFKSLMIFEDLTGKKVGDATDSINDILKMFYSILKGSNKDFEYNFEQFIDLIDDNQEAVEVFIEYLRDLAKDQPTEDKKKHQKNN